MDRLTALVHNRLLLAGELGFEAPYVAREAVAFAREVGVTEEQDVVRLAMTVRALGPVLGNDPAARALALGVLGRRDIAPSARLDYVERTWLLAEQPKESP